MTNRPEDFSREELFDYIVGDLPPERVTQLELASKEDDELAAKLAFMEHFSSPVPSRLIPIEVFAPPSAVASGEHALTQHRDTVAGEETIIDAEWTITRRRSRYWIAAVVVLLIAAVVFAVMWFMERTSRSDLEQKIEEQEKHHTYLHQKIDNLEYTEFLMEKRIYGLAAGQFLEKRMRIALEGKLFVARVDDHVLHIYGDVTRTLRFRSSRDADNKWHEIGPNEGGFVIKGVGEMRYGKTPDDNRSVYVLVVEKGFDGLLYFAQEGMPTATVVQFVPPFSEFPNPEEFDKFVASKRSGETLPAEKPEYVARDFGPVFKQWLRERTNGGLPRNP